MPMALLIHYYLDTKALILREMQLLFCLSYTNDQRLSIVSIAVTLNYRSLKGGKKCKITGKWISSYTKMKKNSVIGALPGIEPETSGL